MVTHAVHSRFGKDSLRMTNLLHALSAISAMLNTNFHSRDIVSEIISMRSSESRERSREDSRMYQRRCVRFRS